MKTPETDVHYRRNVPEGTYYDWSHPLFKDERGIDFLEKKEEEAVLLYFFTFL